MLYFTPDSIASSRRKRRTWHTKLPCIFVTKDLLQCSPGCFTRSAHICFMRRDSASFEALGSKPQWLYQSGEILPQCDLFVINQNGKIGKAACRGTISPECSYLAKYHVSIEPLVY